MTRLKLALGDDLMEMVSACVEQLWPGEGVRGIRRFIRDAIRRYLRYCKNDKS